MERFGEGQDGDRSSSLPRSPRIMIAVPEKFTGHVLVPDHSSGKDGIFLQRFGFRPRNAEDANTLVAEYIAQAQSKLTTGDYFLTFSHPTAH